MLVLSLALVKTALAVSENSEEALSSNEVVLNRMNHEILIDLLKKLNRDYEGDEESRPSFLNKRMNRYRNGETRSRAKLLHQNKLYHAGDSAADLDRLAEKNKMYSNLNGRQIDDRLNKRGELNIYLINFILIFFQIYSLFKILYNYSIQKIKIQLVLN